MTALRQLLAFLAITGACWWPLAVILTAAVGAWLKERRLT